MMPSRASTPPTVAIDDTNASLTPEQVRTLAENRLKAKASIQEKERQARERDFHPAPRLNAKRPLQVVPANSTSPTAPGRRTYPNLGSSARVSSIASTSPSSASKNATASSSGSNGHQKPDQAHFTRDDPSEPLKNMIGTYVEYDLATLKNSRGGFLLESEEDDPRKLKEIKLMEENKLKRLENQRRQGALRDPGLSMDPERNPKCVHCGTIELDTQLQIVFGEFCCPKCKADRPEMYSLLTKTECKEDYLLTDQLKDEELLPHLLRPNPHRPTYSNMMLFLRCQVEAFAFSKAKWGSAESLDREFNRREAEKKEKKSKIFEKKLKDLRRRTRTNVWHKRIDSEHRHTFEMMQNHDGHEVEVCTVCNFVVDVEVF